MKEFKNYREITIRTSADRAEIETLLNDGWKIFDKGIYIDADGNEPDRAFYRLRKDGSSSDTLNTK